MRPGQFTANAICTKWPNCKCEKTQKTDQTFLAARRSVCNPWGRSRERSQSRHHVPDICHRL